MSAQFKAGLEYIDEAPPIQPGPDSWDEAVAFLEQLRPGGPWVLSAIVPDGPIDTITALAPSDVRAFVARHNGKRNLYFSVNPTREALSRKAAKTDIAAIEYVLADCDPNPGEAPTEAKARYLSNLERFKPYPTAVIDSGNGIQCLWRLEEALVLGGPISEMKDGKRRLVLSAEDQATVADAENRIKAVMVKLGAKPGTQNVDRILRLPGTTNLPNKKKRNEGRKSCQAALLEFNNVSYPLSAFPPDQSDTGKSFDWNGLPEHLRHRMLSNVDIMRRWRGDQSGLNDTTRSAMDMSLGSLLKGRGFSYEEMCTILRAFSYGRGAENTERDFNRIWERSGCANAEPILDYIERINRDHAVVRLGAQTLILQEHPEEPPQFISAENLHLWFANDKVEIGNHKISVSRAWLAHPSRRQYLRVVFDPRDTNTAHYNFWRGFACEPDPSKSCELFLAHVRDNICAGNEAHYKWVIGFLAHMVQRPWEKPGVCLVLRGQEGTGKGFFANVVGRLCPQHFCVVSQAVHLTGRFNAHLARALLVFVDEAFWAGDKAGEGALKHLVTDEQLMIEGKHRDPITVRNLSRLIIASNEKWVVPAGTQARRWCVLDVAATRANDRAYFRAIADELDNGGMAALMHYLMTFDLALVDVHTTPKTSALLEQKEESLPPHAQWWLETLKRGTLRYENRDCSFLDPNKFERNIETDGWPVSIQKEHLWEACRLWMREHNVRSRVITSMWLHRWLNQAQLLPGAKETKPHGQKRQLWLPTLDACRAAFDIFVGQPSDWQTNDPDKPGKE
jgi:hypothetical protein